MPATWLDRELVAEVPVPLRDNGVGWEARDALARRQQWLIAQGLAGETDAGFVTRRDMLAALARREVEEAGKKLARQQGLEFRMAESGERISGTYRQSVQLVSDKCALVEHAREFTLVPWRPVIEKALSRRSPASSGTAASPGISAASAGPASAGRMSGTDAATQLMINFLSAKAEDAERMSALSRPPAAAERKRQLRNAKRYEKIKNRQTGGSSSRSRSFFRNGSHFQ